MGLSVSSLGGTRPSEENGERGVGVGQKDRGRGRGYVPLFVCISFSLRRRRTVWSDVTIQLMEREREKKKKHTAMYTNTHQRVGSFERLDENALALQFLFPSL